MGSARNSRCGTEGEPSTSTIRSRHLPLEHHQYEVGLQVPEAYEFRVSLQDVDGTWMWLDLPEVTGQETPSQAYGKAVEQICRWVDGK